MICYYGFVLNFGRFYPCAAELLSFKFLLARLNFTLNLERTASLRRIIARYMIATYALNFQNEREVFVKFNKISEIFHRFNLFFIKKY